MAPTVLTTSLTSGGYHPADKSQIATMKKDAGLNLDADGSSTPYSATSTAVSEAGDKSPKGKSHLANAVAKAFVDSNLPAVNPSPTDSGYYSNLLASSYPTPETKAGTTVFCSGVAAFEAFAVKHSESVWVYDDAVEVGFGARVAGFNSNKVHQVQTREGAGLELAGYSRKTTGKLSVFASIKTLPYLLPSLDKIQGDVIINVSTVTTDEDLKLVDGLYSPGVMKNLTSLPEGWDVVFSLSGEALLAIGAKVYGREPRKTVHVVSSVSWSREIQKHLFPAPDQGEIWTVQHFNMENCSTVYFGAVSWLIHNIWDAGLPPKAGLLEIKTLDPSPEKLYSALATPEGQERKTVCVLGATKADADALKAVFLSALYSASGSSKLQLPIVKSVIATKPADLFTPNFQAKPGKVVSFYTSPISPTPELLAHLFLSSPSLNTRLAQFGSSAARGVKSILAIAPSDKDNCIIEVDQPSDVTWVNDANVLKSTDVLSSAKEGSILVLELPWSEEEVAVKLTRSEIATIKEKKIRVFLLDLAAGPVLPIQEQVAFLLLYTGSQRLSQGVWKVLDAFHSNQVAREDVEAAQAALVEVNAAGWEVPELEEGKTEKAKAVWEWDALPGRAGVVDVQSEAKPASSAWQLAARHLFFREAFAVPEAKVVDTVVGTPGVAALRPSTADETFLVTVSENRRLTPATYDRNVFHLELDTSGTGLKYEIGEAIGIHGWNDTQEVLDFCAWYGLQPDDLVTFPNPLKSGTMETRTIFQLLQQNVDLFGRPGKAFYAALSKIATAKADAMTLKFISAPEGAELFKRMAEDETVTFADVLFRFKTARPSVEELVGLIPEIKPRHYSIASSNKAVGDKVELLIVTVDWVNSKGSPRFGQCTRYLAALAPGAKVTVSIKPSVMKLPPDNKQPIIMAGLGTGAAPFRAFMQHRAWQRTQGIEVGPLIYYFGSRYRSQEYLYGEEIEAYIASGIISHAGLAFSRDSDSKTYIQHKMSADKKMLAKLLKGQGSDAAYFYLCGPTWPVPDVFEALVGSLTEDGMERKQAEEFIEELKEEERYVLEVY